MPNNVIEPDPSYYPEHMPDSHILTLGHSTVRADLEGLEYQMLADKAAERLDRIENTLATKQPRSQASLKDKALGSIGLNDRVMSRREERHVNQELQNIVVAGTVDGRRIERHILDNDDHVNDMLKQTRMALRWLKNKPDKWIEAETAVLESMPPYQFAVFQKDHQKREGLSALEWLSEEKADSMPDSTAEEREAKQRQAENDKHKLLNFLQAHNAYIAERQQRPKFVEAVQKQKEIWSTAVERGLAEGWLHQYAKVKLDKVDDFDIYEGDFFTTYLVHKAGYYLIGDTNQVSVARGRVNSTTTLHEMNHALLETFPDDLSKPFGDYWVVESITEELTQSMHTGNFGEFNTDVGTYREERELLKTVLEIGDYLGSDVTFADFTRAYSAPKDEQGELVYAIMEKFCDSGYPDMNLFAGIKEIMRQTREDIDANPEYSQLLDYQKRSLEAKITAQKLRRWAKTMSPRQREKEAIS